MSADAGLPWRCALHAPDSGLQPHGAAGGIRAVLLRNRVGLARA